MGDYFTKFLYRNKTSHQCSLVWVVIITISLVLDYGISVALVLFWTLSCNGIILHATATTRLPSKLV